MVGMCQETRMTDAASSKGFCMRPRSKLPKSPPRDALEQSLSFLRTRPSVANTPWSLTVPVAIATWWTSDLVTAPTSLAHSTRSTSARSSNRTDAKSSEVSQTQSSSLPRFSHSLVLSLLFQTMICWSLVRRRASLCSSIASLRNARLTARTGMASGNVASVVCVRVFSPLQLISLSLSLSLLTVRWRECDVHPSSGEAR